MPDGLTINTEREWQEVRPVTEPDPEWEEVDSEGHTHAYDEELNLPTLEWVVLREYWCETCCDFHQEGEFRCRKCAESVSPGTRPGQTHHVLIGDRITGEIAANHPLYKRVSNTLMDGKPVDLTTEMHGRTVSLEGVIATELDREVVSFVAMQAHVSEELAADRPTQEDGEPDG